MLKMAVIGCGVIGNVHCWAIKNDQRSKLGYVCDIIEDRASAMANDYECQPINDYRIALDDPTIDAVTIALPHFEHFRLFQDALSAGKHVICEKPLTIDPANLAQMIKLAKETPLKTTCVFQHRFAPIIEVLIKYVQLGALGELTEGFIEFTCDRTAAYYDSAQWRGTWQGEGGGMLINQAIHTIDLLTLFFGRPTAVDGHAARKRLTNIEVEDFAQATVEYDNGTKVFIQSQNVVNGGWSPQLTLKGDKGEIILDGCEKILHLETDSNQMRSALEKAERGEREVDAPGKECYGCCHDMAIADFTQAICDDTQPRLSIAEAAIANELVLAIYHSTATGHPAKLPLNQYEQPCL